MKKLAIFAAAFVLTLGLAQCKKEQPTAQTTEGETVHITVNVGNNGSKANVDPTDGHITFKDGDKLYVGYNGAKVGGELTYSTENSSFSGTLTISQSGLQRLHFYYLGGNLTPTVSGSQYTVDISNQTSNYPVISYGTSTTNYTGSGAYETTLLNQCGLVKFNLSTSITTPVISVSGLYTKATIDFANPGVVTPSTEGPITLHSGANNNERWAILLPQTGVSATTTINDKTYSIPSFDVAINDYNTTGVNIIPLVDITSISDDFKVTENVIITGTPTSDFFTIWDEYPGNTTYEVTLDNVNPEGSKQIQLNNITNIKLKGTSRLRGIYAPGSPSGVTINEAEAGGMAIVVTEDIPLEGTFTINGGTLKAKSAGNQSALEGSLIVNGGAVYLAGGSSYRSAIYNGSVSGSVTLYGWNGYSWGAYSSQQYASTDNSASPSTWTW